MYIFVIELATENNFIKLKFVPINERISDWKFSC